MAAAAWTRNALRGAQELDTFAQSTGTTVQTLQRLEAAGAQVGLTFDDISDVLQTFTESVGLAQRGIVAGTGGAQVDALRFLGFNEEDILRAEQDVVGFFERFYGRLRSLSAAQQQEIVGEFSLPDAARRLLALGDTPLEVAATLNIPELDTAEVARLNDTYSRLTVASLRFERSLQQFLVRNADSIDEFLTAIERNTPAILRAGAVLASALGEVAGLIVRVFQLIEAQIGTGRDSQTGETRLTGNDIFSATAIAAIVGGVPASYWIGFAAGCSLYSERYRGGRYCFGGGDSRGRDFVGRDGFHCRRRSGAHRWRPSQLSRWANSSILG